MNGFILLSAMASFAAAQTEPAAFAVPPPIEQYTADCSRPTYASDQLVCGDPELRSLDDRLALLLSEKSTLAQRSGSDFFEAQPAWLKRRSMCAMQVAHRTCLAAAYAERIRVIEVVGTIAPTQSRAKRCKLGQRREAISLASSGPNEVVVMSPNGEVIGLASLQAKDDQWRPFLRYTKAKSKIVLSGSSGSFGKCRLPD